MHSLRKEVVFLFLFMIVSFFMISSPVFAQERTEVSLSGKVVDSSTEQSLSGVEVNIEGMDESARTDEEGNYHFDTLQPGNYTITVETEGYETWEKEVELTEESKTMDIRLEPAEHNP